MAREADIAMPALTPFVGDAMWVDAWPEATDAPARNLYEGDGPAGVWGGTALRGTAWGARVPLRAGCSPGKPCRAPSPPPAWTATSRRFKLDRLWQFYWHRGYVQPATRPR